MYITYKETNYPCKVSVGATMRYAGLPEEFPAPVDAEIILCDDEGFEMRVDNPADYLRQTFEGGVLVLTNQPEPAEAEETPSLTAAELREAAYNTEKIIEWDGEMLTVTQAATLWSYYAAEGSEKADALTLLIAEAKTKIREQYPDEEVAV